MVRHSSDEPFANNLRVMTIYLFAAGMITHHTISILTPTTTLQHTISSQIQNLSILTPSATIRLVVYMHVENEQKVLVYLNVDTRSTPSLENKEFYDYMCLINRDCTFELNQVEVYSEA